MPFFFGGDVFQLMLSCTVISVYSNSLPSATCSASACIIFQPGSRSTWSQRGNCRLWASAQTAELAQPLHSADRGSWVPAVAVTSELAVWADPPSNATRRNASVNYCLLLFPKHAWVPLTLSQLLLVKTKLILSGKGLSSHFFLCFFNIEFTKAILSNENFKIDLSAIYANIDSKINFHSWSTHPKRNWELWKQHYKISGLWKSDLIICYIDSCSPHSNPPVQFEFYQQKSALLCWFLQTYIGLLPLNLTSEEV